MKFWETPQPVTRTMSFSIRWNPTLPTLLTNAAPNASSVTPSGASTTTGPRGEMMDSPWPRWSNASVAMPAASRSATSGA